MIFARPWSDGHDFTDEAKVELFNHESYGTPLTPHNGYALGKKWLNVQVAMWFEDMANGLLFKHELYEDPLFPHWWLDSVFKGKTIKVDQWWRS